MRQWQWSALGALLVSACAIAPPQRASEPGAALPLLSPASLGATRQVAQLLRGEYGDSSFSLRCVIKVDATQLTVVGLTALGLRAFTLNYDGQRLSEERAPQMPATPTGAGLLNDLQLAYWPLAKLQEAWHTAGVEVSEPYSGTRRLRRAGVLLAEVHYAAEPWNGRVWLRHFDHPYSLYIESSPLEQGHPLEQDQ